MHERQARLRFCQNPDGYRLSKVSHFGLSLAARTIRAAIAVSFLVFGTNSVWAQPVSSTGSSFAAPSAAAVRIDVAQAPLIDGDLSDPIWAKATVIDRFTQKRPNPGEPETERTVLRILFDENNLYFAVYAYDSQPDQIITGTMQRDGQLGAADSIVLLIDPGLTRRNAYGFEVSASGARRDELELNNTIELPEWNAIWTAMARKVADGWVAEIAIPFRSLSYDAAQTVWGFDISRRLRHKNERDYWSGYNPALPFSDVSQAGSLTGISNVNRGIGLDVQVYGALRAKHDWQVPGDGAGISFTAGGNAYYKVTPALTNTVTINPDFSDAPLDIRQVNTTRFSLFTPETRSFFLQDVGAFEFGGRNFGRNVTDRTSNNGRPFFSRNIGLSQGLPISLIAGDKLSGQYGGFDIGAIGVLTDRTPTSPGQFLSVLRVSHPVLSESKVGFIATNGDPTGLTRNTVAGLDFQYRNSNFLGGSTFISDAYYQRSFSSGTGNGDSAALALNFPNQPWSADFVFKQIGADFRPALGFVNRTAIRQYQGALAHLTRYRNRYLQELEFGTEYLFVANLGGRLESQENTIYVRAASTIGDTVILKLIGSRENVPRPFLLPSNVPVLAKEYEWTNINARFFTFDGRVISVDAEVTCCSFYDGKSLDTSIKLTYRPGPYFDVVPVYRGTFIRLPTGDVDIHLFTLDSVINFTPNMNLALQIQYDNISENFGLSLRYRWEYRLGNEIFVGLGQNATVPGAVFVPRTTQVSLRLGQTFRF
jgi:Carbohydrate family 9 binding domain-like